MSFLQWPSVGQGILALQGSEICITKRTSQGTHRGIKVCFHQKIVGPPAGIKGILFSTLGMPSLHA